METIQIKYTKGYKYILDEDACFFTGIFNEPFSAKKVEHRADGWLLIDAGFGWDGCSGPTWDDDTNMRAGLVHDALYYLHRHGFPIKHRPVGDNMLESLMIRDRAWPIRAAYYKKAVGKFGRGSADPKAKRKILTAPKKRR